LGFLVSTTSLCSWQELNKRKNSDENNKALYLLNFFIVSSIN